MPPGAGMPGNWNLIWLVISEGTCDSHRARLPEASGKPDADISTTRPVPLSWLNSAWRWATMSGWFATKAREPSRPFSSDAQCPTRMVRRGWGAASFRIRIASIIVIVPVPLSGLGGR